MALWWPSDAFQKPLKVFETPTEACCRMDARVGGMLAKSLATILALEHKEAMEAYPPMVGGS